MNNEIENYYKDIDETKMGNLKKILELSQYNNLNILKKNKNNWKLKDKRQILKECDSKKKNKIKELKNIYNTLSKLTNTPNLINEIKRNNSNLIKELESINNLADTVEKYYPEEDDFIESYSN
jgi:hypothetical protein